MKEVYFLNKKELPTMPVPHDCIIKKINIENDFMEFIFEDDISYHDLIKNIDPDAKSLKIKYHIMDKDYFSIYKWEKPDNYRHIDYKEFINLPKIHTLEYLYHNVGYNSLIIKLMLQDEIIIDIMVDYIEYEWIN